MLPEMRARLRADWIAALDDFTLTEIREACREALAGRAADAVNEERIREIVQRNRGRKLALHRANETKPERTEPRVTKDQADAILAGAGFAPKRFGGEE